MILEKIWNHIFEKKSTHHIYYILLLTIKRRNIIFGTQKQDAKKSKNEYKSSENHFLIFHLRNVLILFLHTSIITPFQSIFKH